MKNSENQSRFSRRKFCGLLSGLLAAPVFLPGSAAADESKTRSPLAELFEGGEWQNLQTSAMAMEIDRYFGSGYSCAEAMLLAALRRLDLPETQVWGAAAFGGGLGRKDLCGYLTGAMMAFGLAAGKLPATRVEAKKTCAAAAREFWTWWQERYPLHCRDIIPAGADRNVCRILGPRSAQHAELIINGMEIRT